MFYLHSSNKTENLLHHYAALVEADPPPSLFTQEHILVQSKGMERMISQFMAERFTSWCNYNFHLPLSFLEYIANILGADIKTDYWERSFLSWRIEGLLRKIPEDVFLPLRNYLLGELTDLKRFQLARQLANLFDQYQLMRPSMLQGWERKKTKTSEKSEQWQMEIWNRLLGQKSMGQHRGELLHRVISALHQEQDITGLPDRVVVFGVHTMPRIFLEYLQGLSKHCDIHLFLLNSCKNYQGLQAAKKTSGQHPLLHALGKQGRDFQEMLLDAVNFAREFESFEDPLGEEHSLLNRIQSDIFHNRVEKGKYKADDDNSVRVISCHTIVRELNVLKDHILNLLKSDETLQLRDIVVMAPDIQDYAPFISSVFEDIQHSIADRSLKKKNDYIQVFNSFLSLLSGRFGWAEVLELLQSELVYPNFSLQNSDLEKIQNWVISSGIRWGLSPKERKRKGYTFFESCWEGGLERLLMGFVYDSEKSVANILPYHDMAGGDARPLGGLCEFISFLKESEESCTKKHTLGEWAEILQKYIHELFGENDDNSLFELKDLTLKLYSFSNVHGDTVDFLTLKNWFESSIVESRSISGFLRGHLTFCSMLPMRSIPFKAIAILGLNYGKFPHGDSFSSYDLTKLFPGLGDRSLRSDDRYQFLEAIVSARDSLYLSYLGQSVETGEKIPPSTVLGEFLELLEKEYGEKDIVEHHPLHPFSSRYFTGNSNLYSFSEENCKIAQSFTPACHEKTTKWWSSVIKEKEGTTTIEIGELLHFFRNPQDYFIEKCVGIPLRWEKVLPEEQEIFSADNLSRYFLGQSFLEKGGGGETFQELRKTYMADGNWPLGAIGELSFENFYDEINDFYQKLQSFNMGGPLPPAEIETTVNDITLSGRLAGQYENGTFLFRYAKMKGKDLLGAYLHHLLKLCGGEDKPTILVMKDCTLRLEGGSLSADQLSELVNVYLAGCSSPSKLLVEPALRYCKQTSAKKARITPLEKARNEFLKILQIGGEQGWQMLYGDVQDVIAEEILDHRFEELCQKIMLPLWSFVDGG